jgi:hypothetical protein
MIAPSSNAFEFFMNPPASIYRKFYFFNVTNPQEIGNGRKPILVQMGPYTYKYYITV